MFGKKRKKIKKLEHIINVLMLQKKLLRKTLIKMDKDFILPTLLMSTDIKALETAINRLNN